jgi:hypothetical protein
MYIGVVHDEHTFWYRMYLVDVLFMILYFIVDISFVSWHGMIFDAWKGPRIIIERVVVL